MKYIVYKTTNLVNNYIYIGVHKTETPDIFDGYLGCGVNIHNPYSYEKSKTKFQQAVKEFGVKNFHREILAIYDTPEEAYGLEGEIVNENFLSRNDVYNMILGGVINSAFGIKVYQYDLQGNFLAEFESYADAANKLNVDATSVRRGVVYKCRIHDSYFNSDKVDKLDLSNYTLHDKVRIHQYLKTGEYDKSFESLNDAARYINGSPANIRHAAIVGYCVYDKYYYSYIKDISFDRARKKQILTREVSKYDSNGIYITTYASQMDAEKDNPNCNITKCIKLKSVDANGNFWALEKLKEYNKPTRKFLKVASFDNDGNIIKIWDSARKCIKEVGSGVQNVLLGRYSKHKGVIYKYINN